MSRIAIVFGALLLASASFLFSISSAGQRISPLYAAGAFPLNGVPSERLAYSMYRSSVLETRNSQASVSPATVLLARQAYAREPLSPEALALIARDMGTRTKIKELALLEAANLISRRSNQVSLDLMAAYAYADNQHENFKVLDQLLSRNSVAQGPLLDGLSAMVANSNMRPSVLRLLSRNPPWAPQFWRRLAQSAQGLPGAAELRLARARQNASVDPDLDRMLIEGLAGQGLFGDAERIGNTLFPEAGISRKQEIVLRNTSFSFQPDYLPFDWRLISNGDYGTTIDLAHSVLAISALAGSSGTAAEQLVHLSQGAYRLSVQLDPRSAPAGDHLGVSLICADQAANILFKDRITRLPALINNSTCTWAYLRVFIQLPSDAQDMDWAIQNIVLRPIAKD